MYAGPSVPARNLRTAIKSRNKSLDSCKCAPIAKQKPHRNRSKTQSKVASRSFNPSNLSKNQMASNEVNGPPPAKRPRLSEQFSSEDNTGQKNTVQPVKSTGNGATNMEEVEVEDDEMTEEFNEHSRPSDLYLDTVSNSPEIQSKFITNNL